MLIITTTTSKHKRTLSSAATFLRNIARRSSASPAVATKRSEPVLRRTAAAAAAAAQTSRAQARALLFLTQFETDPSIFCSSLPKESAPVLWTSILAWGKVTFDTNREYELDLRCGVKRGNLNIPCQKDSLLVFPSIEPHSIDQHGRGVHLVHYHVHACSAADCNTLALEVDVLTA